MRFAATHYAVRVKAYNKYKYALKKGTLIKPKVCSVCGCGGRIEGHHEDYSKPLMVRWLCSACHAIVHSYVYSFKRVRNLFDKGQNILTVSRLMRFVGIKSRHYKLVKNSLEKMAVGVRCFPENDCRGIRLYSYLEANAFMYIWRTGTMKKAREGHLNKS